MAIEIKLLITFKIFVLKIKSKPLIVFLEEKNLRKIKKNADIILASNVFAHSDKLKEMAKCMFKLLKKNGTIVIEVQYLLNTLKDLTFDNIYHEHYNYWSLTSLINFFKQFDAKIIKAEKVNTDSSTEVVDVRRPGEYSAEHIEGSKHAPLSFLTDHLDSLPKGEFYIHCAGGYRSVIANSILKKNGIHNAIEVLGGYNSIKKTDAPRTDFICPDPN